MPSTPLQQLLDNRQCISRERDLATIEEMFGRIVVPALDAIDETIIENRPNDALALAALCLAVVDGEGIGDGPEERLSGLPAAYDYDREMGCMSAADMEWLLTATKEHFERHCDLDDMKVAHASDDRGLSIDIDFWDIDEESRRTFLLRFNGDGTRFLREIIPTSPKHVQTRSLEIPTWVPLANVFDWLSDHRRLSEQDYERGHKAGYADGERNGRLIAQRNLRDALGIDAVVAASEQRLNDRIEDVDRVVRPGEYNPCF